MLQILNIDDGQELKMTQKINPEGFPLAEARTITHDLMTPNPSIYWFDFGVSITLGWGAFYFSVVNEMLSLVWWASYIFATLALYRAVLFTHELAHFKKGTFGTFRFFWNFLCGCLMLAPSFFYNGVHNDHHKRDIYGTSEDGEYLPFGAQNPYRILTYLLQIVVLPLLIAVRFLIMAPLGWIFPPIGRLVWERMSSLTIDINYKRPIEQRAKIGTWKAQEILASFNIWLSVFLIYNGVLPIEAAIMWYLVLVLVLLLNSLRTLGAHAYRNPGDKKMSVSEQYLDSVNVSGKFITALWAPVGLRFHATHHLFPIMPYHNLAEAHERLRKELPDNGLYLSTSRNGMWHALSTLWVDAKASQIKPRH